MTNEKCSIGHDEIDVLIWCYGSWWRPPTTMMIFKAGMWRCCPLLIYTFMPYMIHWSVKPCNPNLNPSFWTSSQIQSPNFSADFSSPNGRSDPFFSFNAGRCTHCQPGASGFYFWASLRLEVCKLHAFMEEAPFIFEKYVYTWTFPRKPWICVHSIRKYKTIHIDDIYIYIYTHVHDKWPL